MLRLSARSFTDQDLLFRAGSLCIILLVSFLLLFLTRADSAQGSSRQAIVLEIQGAIGPAVSDYVIQGLQEAAKLQAEVVVLQIDTPGGLDSAMRDIIREILNSPVPVISYVYPDGARAASAGTYILYASHIAAMAPATNLGAATPVQIGGIPTTDPKEDDKEADNGDSTAPKSAMERKVTHDAAAYIRSLAARHGRNSEWAERAVREAVSLTAQEALVIDVIDIVATDLADLFNQADQKTVIMSDGPRTLDTSDLVITPILPDWKTKILAIISDPNIAYLLLLFGIYGLIYELANPGVFFPGVAGAIAILLALYGFQVLPVNYSGLALLLLGITLMISEAFVPSFGSLGIGGVVAFIVGSLILFDEESFRVSRTLIAITSLLSASFILWLMGRLVTFRKKRVRTGSEALIGMIGEASADFIGHGRVLLLGESWQAVSNEHLHKGDMVEVTAVNGLVLTVKKIKEV